MLQNVHLMQAWLPRLERALESCAETAHQERLVQASLTELPLEDRCVDAVIATGVFTHGHVGPKAFSEVLRVVRSGGWVAITCRN